MPPPRKETKRDQMSSFGKLLRENPVLELLTTFLISLNGSICLPKNMVELEVLTDSVNGNDVALGDDCTENAEDEDEESNGQESGIDADDVEGEGSDTGTRSSVMVILDLLSSSGI
ncbi:hypothetical protein DASC09_046040 [Saccharomycopsis crataegensis]|uniref:Uncharacterized protein n=1 Tax=Saccharomycopsis crataegensis TaxID=43959 RepID=A0AAV5QRB8_9ASCO|nr:hypothetical protein DASC09_046040 [Saccharomycopsis crataegensis]